MIDWAKEKLFDGALDRIKDHNQLKALQEDIESQLNREQEFFENCTSKEEFDFQGLKDCLLTKFIEEKTLAGFAIIEKTKRDKIKELIQNECICDAKAETKSSKDRVRAITDNCFSIVDNFLRSRVSIENSVLGGQIADNVNEHTDEAIDNAEKNISQKIDALGEKIDSQIPAPAQSEKITFKNDNQAYLDAFTNPLFLEDEDKDEHVVSLAEMYISPSIKDKDIKASECIKKWYGTRTKPCLLIYGDAGVGKSSFVSKILADANGITEKSKTEFIFDSSKVMAVALRNHTDKIDNKLTAKEILATLFSCDSVDQLKDKLIILDGLDELCVLIPGFEGQSFLSKLSQLDYGFHVLVTSREADSYFRLPNDEAGLKTERLVWEKKQIKGWLKLYKGKKPHMAGWCFKFYKQFRSLGTNDTRSVIFCVPIILYICATSKTDLENHSNIGSIYRDAFSDILLRKYIQGQHNTYELREADKEAALTAWQYTKELAYQMFLLNTLDLVEDDELEGRHAIGFRNAKKRTADILKKEYTILNPDLELKKELAICPFAKENGTGGVTFAHKTVYEYFTAVKLYEDYFAKFTKDYFENHQKEAPSDVIKASIEAFRYKAIPEDVFRYLYTLDYAPFDGVSRKRTVSFDSEGFIKGYIDGMKQHLFAKIGIEPAIEEYIYPPQINNPNCNESDNQWMQNSINVQLSRSYANLTWFLTGHGFSNEQNEHESVEVGKLLTGADNTANFNFWKFNSANLFEADLSGSYMRSVNLDNTNLERAILSHADLSDSSTQNANFINADLLDAKLKDATFNNSDFRGANLNNANLRAASFPNSNFYNASLRRAYLNATHLITVVDLKDADLTDAEYCTNSFSRTEFPDDFDPKEYDMIEVDISGNHVKE